MDTDWCLTCDRHFQGSGPYCSTDCQDRAGPSTPNYSPFCSYSDKRSDDDSDDDEVIYHHVDDAMVHAHWRGNGAAGILAWAAEIPACTPSGSIYAHSSSSKTTSPSASTSRLPKLLRPNQRPAPPALCVSTPRTTLPPPTRPIRTSPQRFYGSSANRSADAESDGKTSLLSGATESSLATPASSHVVPIIPSKDRPSVLGAIAGHVRSWVTPTSPLVASPSSQTHYKQRITAASVIQDEPHKFTIVAHTHRSPAFYPSESSFDDEVAAWKVSSTILVDAPRAKLDRAPTPYRPRGRKLSRV
ncbi:hypothetical protein Hypma_011959 [Hypsizygus marmoreus]|uniref:Uncharacterized protein n=1 Tax=Hypsizygus marmoreus TaxID=39966 RepID=A0A369JJS1_HYPMA|nr:hypothetical protein Hypma_011959 [Hypsizygus marmoreus]